MYNEVLGDRSQQNIAHKEIDTNMVVYLLEKQMNILKITEHLWSLTNPDLTNRGSHILSERGFVIALQPELGPAVFHTHSSVAEDVVCELVMNWMNQNHKVLRGF